MRIPLTRKRFFSFAFITPCASALAISFGCRGEATRSPEGAVKPDESAFAIRIDRPHENVTADVPSAPAADDQTGRPLKFAFRVTGSANPPGSDAAAEDRIAAAQAAVIDAFCKALVESRKARGLPAENFTARFSPRLSVLRRSDGDSTETTVKLLFRGINNSLSVKDGALQHPPVDFRIIRRIFEETGGEFALLDTDAARDDERVTASVACYLPPGFEPAPTNVARTDEDAP